MEESLAELRSRCKILEEENEKMKIRMNNLEGVLSSKRRRINGPDTYTSKLQFSNLGTMSIPMASTTQEAKKEVSGDASHRESGLRPEGYIVSGGGKDSEKTTGDIGMSQNAQDLLKKQSSNNGSAPVIPMGEMVDNPLDQQEKLQKFRPDIVKEVNVTSHIIDLMMDDIGTDAIDQIKAKSTEMEKTSELVNVIEQRLRGGCQKAYKTFQKILGGLHPKLFKTLFDRLPLKEEKDFCIQPFRKSLGEKILGKKEHGTDTRVDLPQDLDENFVQLRVMGKSWNIRDLEEKNTNLYSNYQQQLQQEKYEPRNIKVKDILKLGNSKVSKSGKGVVVGRAGIGKTTTVQWLSRQWALGKWADNMVLCFVIQLRVLFACAPKSMTLLQLLTRESICNVEAYDLPANWLKNNQGEGVLVMVDGLDEIAGMLTRLNMSDQKNSVIDITTEADPKKLMLKLIQGKILPHCTVICTSRPFLDLSKIMKNCEMYEILGLTKDGVKKYVQKKYPEKKKEIQSVLVQNPVLLSVCSITFYCTQVTKHLNNDSNLSEEQVATYTRLQSYILQQYASRRDTDLDDRIDAKYYFPKLAKLAYNGIFACKLVDNLPKIVFTCDDLWEVGLTTEDVKESSYKGILTCTGPCYEFFHLSVQELLSCIYIMTSSDIDHESMNKIFDKLCKEGSLNMTLLYLFGVCFDSKDKAIMEYFPNLRGSSKHTACIQKKLRGFLDELVEFANTYHECQTILPLCQIAQETQSADIASHVVETVVRDEGIHFEWQNLTALDIKALLFTCQGSSSLKKIELSQCNLDDSSFSQIAKYLSSDSSVTCLDLSGNLVQGPGLRALGEMLAVNDSLLCLQLKKNQIKDAEAKWLVQGLEINTTLTRLSLKDNLISDDTAEGIAKCITGSITASWEIDLRSNLIGQKGAQALLDSSTHLKPKSILLDKNRAHKKQFDGCTEAIDFGNPSLESHVLFSELHHPGKVNLDDVDLQDSDVKEVIRILSGKKDLLELSLCNNPQLTNASLYDLSQLVFSSPLLNSIHLQGSAICIPKENSVLQSLLPIQLSLHNLVLFEDGSLPSFAHRSIKTQKKTSDPLVKIGYKKTASTTEDIRSVSNLIHQEILQSSNHPRPSLLLTVAESWCSLSCLALCNVVFYAEHVQKLESCLKRLKMSLRVFKIHRVPCHERNTFLPILLFVEDNDPKVLLTTLDISDILLSHDDIKALTHALKSNSNLKHLRLRIHYKFPETSLNELGAALSDNTVLQTLSLGWQLSDQDVAPICKALLRNSTLQHVDIGYNSFRGGDAMVDVINFIKSSISLISINITSAFITAEAMYLKDALRKTKKLKYIGLPGLSSGTSCENMVKGVWDAMTKRDIKELHGQTPDTLMFQNGQDYFQYRNIEAETPHSLMFPDSPEGFHE